MKRKVLIRIRFEGFHCWPQAPDEVSFLREYHRHIFHVTAEKQVNHNEREIEFILLKRQVEEKILSKKLEAETRIWSCEHWAEWLINQFNFCKVEVSEDGENGAVIES